MGGRLARRMLLAPEPAGGSGRDPTYGFPAPYSHTDHRFWAKTDDPRMNMLNARQPADAACAIDELLQPIGLERFLAEYFHRLPLALSGAVTHQLPLITWSKFVSILRSPDVDWMAAQSGSQRSVPRQADRETLETLIGEGCTVLVRHAERHDEMLRNLASDFGLTFRAPVDLHVYATPPKHYGFSWHYDPEDVFLLQVNGEKEFALRKNTVHPWPVGEAIPVDMQYEREVMPLMRARLRAGDLLYVPCGYWHRGMAASGDETAVSISIGLASRTALDLLDQLRPQLLESLIFRQRLPLAATSDPDAIESQSLKTTYRHLLAQVACELSSLLQSESLLKQLVQESVVVRDEPSCPKPS